MAAGAVYPWPVARAAPTTLRAAACGGTVNTSRSARARERMRRHFDNERPWLAVLIAMGLYLTGVLRPLAALESAGGGLWRALRPLASRTLGADRFLPAGGAG